MEQKNRSSSATKAGIGYTIGNYLIKGLNFLTIPLFSRLLSTSDYGLYNTFTATEGILYVLIGLAIHSSYKNAYYRYKTIDQGAEEGKDFETYVSDSMIMILISSFLWMILMLIFHKQVGSWLVMDTKCLLLLVLYSTGFAIGSCYQAYVGLKYEFKSYIKISGFNAITDILVSLFLIFFVFQKQRYLGRMIGTTVAASLMGIWIVSYFLRLRKPRNYSILKWGMKFSLPIVPNGIGQVLLNSFDRLMINRLVSSASAGLYSFAYNIFGIVNVTGISLNNVWEPWLYEQLNKKKEKLIKEKSAVYVNLMAILSILIVLVSPELVLILGGRNYLESVYCVIPVIVGGYFNFLAWLPISVEYYYEKTLRIAFTTFGAAIINIVLNYIFILKFGYIAAAYTTLVTYIIYFAFHYETSRKIHGSTLFSTKDILCSSLVLLLIGAVSLILINYIVIRWAIGILIFIIALWYEEQNVKIIGKIFEKVRFR